MTSRKESCLKTRSWIPLLSVSHSFRGHSQASLEWVKNLLRPLSIFDGNWDYRFHNHRAFCWNISVYDGYHISQVFTASHFMPFKHIARHMAAWTVLCNNDMSQTRGCANTLHMVSNNRKEGPSFSYSAASRYWLKNISYYMVSLSEPCCCLIIWPMPGHWDVWKQFIVPHRPHLVKFRLDKLEDEKARQVERMLYLRCLCRMKRPNFCKVHHQLWFRKEKPADAWPVRDTISNIQLTAGIRYCKQIWTALFPKMIHKGGFLIGYRL